MVTGYLNTERLCFNKHLHTMVMHSILFGDWPDTRRVLPNSHQIIQLHRQGNPSRHDGNVYASDLRVIVCAGQKDVCSPHVVWLSKRGRKLCTIGRMYQMWLQRRSWRWTYYAVFGRTGEEPRTSESRSVFVALVTEAIRLGVIKRDGCACACAYSPSQLVAAPCIIFPATEKWRCDWRITSHTFTQWSTNNLCIRIDDGPLPPSNRL